MYHKKTIIIMSHVVKIANYDVNLKKINDWQNKGMQYEAVNQSGSIV